MNSTLQPLKIRSSTYKLVLGLLSTGTLLLGCQQKPKDFDSLIKEKVKHVVVIYMENHSFDNLYGQFEGADGIANVKREIITQLDSSGQPYQYLPAIPRTDVFPTNLPNALFNIDQYVPSDQEIPDVTHAYYMERMQINGGKMDKFALHNATAGLTMGYYNTKMLPLYEIAKKYTLCDRFFHSAFGCSYLNHQWLIAASTPVFPNAPEYMVAKVDSSGKLIKDGAVTPDGFAVNTVMPAKGPHPANSKPERLLPPQTAPTIGDRLSEKGVSWAWYSGGWDNAEAGHPDPTFQFHHQAFAYYANYADSTKGSKEHLKDEKLFLAAAKEGKLPEVSFVKPLGIDTEHPGYTNLLRGEKHALELINAVLNGPNGKDALIVLTYDENGGFWDHVAPPVIDDMGPGTRIPAILISPFTKKNFVDHSPYETVSILAFIEQRWDLKPLTSRDAKANPFKNAFEL